MTATPELMHVDRGQEAEGGGRVLSTLNRDGSRRWLCPKPSPGRFLTARRVVAWGLIALFVALPFIKINGYPALLLDLPNRRFHVLGLTLLPTDTLLLALFMVGVFVMVFFLTALFGRVWCGWGCPQTVYLEFVYRPLERLFEGTPGRAKKGFLQTSGTGSVLKYACYLLISFILAHVFLSYFVGVETLRVWMTRSPLEHPSSFLIVAGVTAAMMFDFSFFREQTCIVACPYGRLQSVMLDRQSLIVTYDKKRGEPRGRKKNGKTKAVDVSLKVLADAGLGRAQRTGDCVDCKMCVVTCPTGIDIRDGLQMECIGCAQCIDACDHVMTKLGRPKGLIRYSSQAAVEGEKPKMARPRVLIYPTILTIVATLFVLVLAGKGVADMTVVRGMGAPFSVLDSGEVANNAKIKLVNRTDEPMTLGVSARGVRSPGLAGLRVELESEDTPLTLAPRESRTVLARVIAPAAAFTAGVCEVRVVLTPERGEGGGSREITGLFRLLGPQGGAAARPKPAHEDDERHEETHEKEHEE